MPGAGGPGRYTALTDAQASLVRAAGSPDDPLGACRMVQGLLQHPMFAAGPPGGRPDERRDEQSIRPASAILARAIELDDGPLDRPRLPEARVIGTCRHFAVVGAAFLLALGVPARARCGFGGYFEPGTWADHWITEWWSAGDRRWARTDVQWLGVGFGVDVADLPAGPASFLTAGEAWQAFRRGEVDGGAFGVSGTENWGPSEIRGNVMRDLAALEGIEVLPWDTWGPMPDAYEGRTGEDFDRLLDEIAVACASDSGPATAGAVAAAADRARLLAALGPLDLD